jgi:hypothetical protein
VILEIIKISIICYIFYILGESGMIFNFWQRWIEKLPQWLYKPLGGCYKCLTGQAILHYYWITHLHNYNIVDQLFYPSFGILITIILNYFYEKFEKN